MFCYIAILVKQRLIISFFLWERMGGEWGMNPAYDGCLNVKISPKSRSFAQKSRPERKNMGHHSMLFQPYESMLNSVSYYKTKHIITHYVLLLLRFNYLCVSLPLCLVFILLPHFSHLKNYYCFFFAFRGYDKKNC